MANEVEQPNELVGLHLAVPAQSPQSSLPQ
jgi:hypothetical protein